MDQRPKNSVKSRNCKIWMFGDDINTDLIVPSKYLTERDPDVIVRHTLESVDPEFAPNVSPGDIIVAGKNFGSGSSREEAVFVFKELGIQTIIAESFARIFYRNCFNLGIPAILLPNALEQLKGHQFVAMDLDAGQLQTDQTTLMFKPLPPFLIEMVQAGGALALLCKKRQDCS